MTRNQFTEAGAERGSPPRFWWDAAGRIVLAVQIGLPGLLLVTLNLLRLFRGDTQLSVVVLPLVIALLELIAAAGALQGRMGLMALFLGFSVLTGLAGVVARALDTSSAWVGFAGPPLMLAFSAVALIWLGLRRWALTGGARSRQAAQACTLVLLLGFAVGVPDLSRRIGLGAELVTAGNPATRRVETGQRMPPGAFALPDGSTITPDEPGVLYIMNFWATWCGPCLMELPELLAAVQEASDAPIRLLAVNTEDLPAETLSAFLNGRGLGGLEFVLDPQRIRTPVGLDTIPLTLLVRDGEVLERHEGFRPGLFTAERLRELATAGPDGGAGGDVGE